eukprot:CAMPEP_0201578656 /NCGR_PEP_ID=MMETSP0190_2-20130828/25650_1 /ASSEMBLY_ACC=CAM_ASM_000263 /TAXON_ID=37353 /ORGANISM="Rosalina sp." /LENGTH=147 /DNA_ID=CAMNT_0048012087 /DNA_START=62 /DNA_END=502 /DNA_ORIENTATION=-
MSAINYIECSGTYKILMEMGFDSFISHQATKIYLNDIESAVDYCSSGYDHSSSDGDDNKSDTSDNGTSDTDLEISISSVRIPQQPYQPGSYFARCYDILQIKYPIFTPLFEQWFIEEEFDDESLIDEFKNNQQYNQSFFIQFVEDNW